MYMFEFNPNGISFAFTISGKNELEAKEALHTALMLVQEELEKSIYHREEN